VNSLKERLNNVEVKSHLDDEDTARMKRENERLKERADKLLLVGT